MRKQMIRSARHAAPMLFCLLALPTGARADHGASDERVSLPDGPGSIGGVGDNVDIDANMGAMTYSVAIDVPRGHAGATPSVALAYSSAAGSSEVGVGWSMGVQSIERMRARGLPVYDETDEFAVDGGAELVQVGMSGTSVTYRARYERAFVRYQWRDVGAGSGGYWIAEHPDGSISYYGADETGTTVRTARVETPTGGCYRYMLVARQDVFGNVVRYRYVKDGETSLLDEIDYAEDGAGTPRFSVRFAYEARGDLVQTGEPGFVLTLSQRLREIRVRSGSETIRRTVLGYESDAQSGGVSRLGTVTQYGRDDELSPIRFTFGYSRSLDGACDGSCEGPFVVDMGSLPAGVDVRSGRATLIDIDGDALPDILSSDASGRHTFVPTRMDPDTGRPSWGASYASTATTASSSFVVGAPGVQVLDVNGDGFTDIIESRNGSVLCNDGSGDWGGTACLMDARIPSLEQDDVGDQNPLHVRFFDYDDDKRIDLLRTVGDVTEVFVNDGTSFAAQSAEPIGAVFDESPTLQLADLNGDGLQDPVEFLSASEMRYRISLGFGRWTDWQSVTFTGFGASDLGLVQLEDVNGDGLSDVVLVAGNEVRYAINRNGSRFDAVVSIDSADVDGDVPERVPDSTVVLFADMNGSGSRDIVWIDGSRVRFLELFPTRPNLLARVENGLGYVQEVEYGTSVRQMWRDAETDPWEHRLPSAMNVVVASDTWERLTATEDDGVHERSEITYRDGYYDGGARAFRGYAHTERVDSADMGDDGQLASRTVWDYEVGADDGYRFGLLSRSQRFGGGEGAWMPLSEQRSTFEDCPLTDVPTSGLRVPVRWICETRTDQIVQEGAPEAEWAVLRTEMEHDGYGQIVRTVQHGVVSRGSPEDPVACDACGEGVAGPCGAQCLGDEAYDEAEYVAPGTATSGRWILGRPVRTSRYGSASGPRTETVTRYDGTPYVGLAEGTLERGAPTSVQTRVSDSEWITSTRVRRDAHGNIVESIDPSGSLEVADDQRTVLTYDDLGIRVVRVDELFVDRAGSPAALRREYAYESAFLEPSEVTDWMLVRGGTVVTARNARRWRYDAFARPVAVLLPGDDDATPTEEFSYELGSPVSRVTVRTRSVQGGAIDREEVECLDGMGREVQTRTRISASQWQVSGFRVLNRRGSPIRVYDAYTASSDACDLAAPTSVPYDENRYDAAGRLVESTLPDEAVFGSRSVVRVQHDPMTVTRFDAEDEDPTSAHTQTPVVERFDGLGRLVSVTRRLADESSGTISLRYDDLGRLVSVLGPDGVEHTQEYDLVDRVVRASDADRGTITLTYDDDGNVVAREDARGARSIAEYDGLDRLIAQWDPSDEAGTRVELTYDADEGCDACTNGARRLVSVRYTVGELGDGVDRVGYDARGRAIVESRAIGDVAFEQTHEYDALGQRLRTIYPGGIEIERGQDGAGRTTSVGGVLEDVRFDDQGRMATLLYANGVEAARSYDDTGRLEASQISSAGRVLQGMTFEYDRVGNIVEIADTSEPEIARPTLAGTFEYDAFYRLSRASLGAGTDDAETLEYQYDVGDRVTTITSSLGTASRAHVGAIEYDDLHPHAASRAGDREYRYDAAGHMTQRGTTALSYDFLGRLRESSEDGASRGRFFYGAGNRRVARIEDGSVTYYLGDEAEVRDGIVYVYPRLGSWRLARMRSATIQTSVLSDVAPLSATDGEIDAADAWIARATAEGIVDGPPDADDPMRLLRGAARRLLALDGGDLAYLHQDHLGSITLSTGSDGETLGEVLYYPSGEVRHRSGFTDEHGYSGQEQDESTGMLAYQFRLLDTDIGRWSSPDPGFHLLTPESAAQFGDSSTGYAFVSNRLGNAVDELGLETSLAAASASVNTARGARTTPPPPTRWQRFKSAVSAGASATVARWNRSFVGRHVNAAMTRYSQWAQKHPIAARTVRFGAKLAFAALIGAVTGGAVLPLIAISAGFQILGLCIEVGMRNSKTLRGWAGRAQKNPWIRWGLRGAVAALAITGLVVGITCPGPALLSVGSTTVFDSASYATVASVGITSLQAAGTRGPPPPSLAGKNALLSGAGIAAFNHPVEDSVEPSIGVMNDGVVLPGDD